MARKRLARKPAARTASAGRPSSLLDTRIIYCGDCLEQLRKLTDGCVDLIYIDPPFNSNRNYKVFWGDRTEPRPPKVRRGGSGSGPRHRFEDRHAGAVATATQQLARVLSTASFYKSLRLVREPPVPQPRLPRCHAPKL